MRGLVDMCLPTTEEDSNRYMYDSLDRHASSCVVSGLGTKVEKQNNMFGVVVVVLLAMKAHLASLLALCDGAAIRACKHLFKVYVSYQLRQ